MDIEGTTTSIDFVHKVLFPYASRHLGDFVRKNQDDPEVKAALKEVENTLIEEEGGITLGVEDCITKLLDWIEQDRKHPALKTLQGLLWKKGYETGKYKGHLYDDVIPHWEKWQEAGLQLGIYSSGSVAAQKLLFGYSEAGDVTPYLSAYFDTKVGHKKEVHSYQKISEQLDLDPEQVLFLSDVGQELDAAKQAGMQTVQLVRPGTKAVENHQVVRDFSEIGLSNGGNEQ